MFSHRTYEILCYMLAALNFSLVINILIDVVISANSSVHIVAILFPCVANIVLAMLLIVGVMKRIPLFIRIFQVFTYVQIVLLTLITTYIYRLVAHGRIELLPAINGTSMLIALFGLEATLANGGLRAILSGPQPFEERIMGYQVSVC